jgi:predicted PurR-regulated permease PerM
MVERLSSRSLLDVLIQAGLIAVLAVFCYGVFHPFRDLMLWSMILAVTLYPLHTRLRHKLGSDGRAATLIVLIGIATMLLPVYFLGISLADSVEHAVSLIRNDEYHIPPPPVYFLGISLPGPAGSDGFQKLSGLIGLSWPRRSPRK